MHGATASVDFYENVIAPYKGALEEWFVSNKSLYIYFLAIFVTVWTVLIPSTKIAWKIFKDLPEKFQTGFRNYVGIVGLESSVKYLLNFGMENIRKKNQNLSNLFRDELMKIPNVVLYGPEDPDKRTSIISFNIKNFDSEKIVQKLEKQNIILAVREIMEKKIIRVSPHFFNNESDMLKVIDELKKL